MTEAQIDEVFQFLRPEKYCTNYGLYYNRKARFKNFDKPLIDDELNRWLVAAYFVGAIRLDTLRQIVPWGGDVKSFGNEGIKNLLFSKHLPIAQRNQVISLSDFTKTIPTWKDWKGWASKW